ncbi:MAG: hypothetical protein ACREMD_05300 [Gemmatimonadota bacterium]
MRRLLSFLLLVPLLMLAASCSDGPSNPLDFSPDPSEPSPSGTGIMIDFSEFGGGDTISSTHGVVVSLVARGERCGDAVIAFNSSDPPGDSRDDLDLGTPNQAFGGPGVGDGGAAGPYQNNRPLGNLLVIQEDPDIQETPNFKDGNPDPMDDCDDGGTVVFDFRELSARGVTILGVTVIDVDDRKQARSEFRLHGEDDRLLGLLSPPVTGPNGVATIDFGGVSGVLRMEVEQRVSVAIARISIMAPDPVAGESG